GVASVARGAGDAGDAADSTSDGAMALPTRTALASSLRLAGAPPNALEALTDELSALLLKLLERKDMRTLVTAARAHCSQAEAVYLVPEHRRLSRHIVDLLYQDDAGDWHIVDYKTGAETASTRTQWQAQLDRYRSVVRDAEGGEIKSARVLQATEARLLDPGEQ
ncbi:MAG: PD-(D/E)XK nuclease family protein, partial [Pseudomonadota bacterium]